MNAFRSEVTSFHPCTFKLMSIDCIPREVSSVLDVGCGMGLIGNLLRLYRHAERIVGVDGYKPYLDFAKDTGAYDELLRMDVADAPLPFQDKEFDLVTCIEVLEHLEYPHAMALLDELERVARRVVVSTTRQSQATEVDGNCLNRHRSRIHPEVFRARGYRVTGAGELAFMTARKTWFPPFFRRHLGSLTTFVPFFSHQYIAVRVEAST